MCHYTTLPNDDTKDPLDDSSTHESNNYEQTFFCHDHGVAADDGESNSSDHEYQDGEFVCYWKHREIGWNDSEKEEDDGRYHDHNISNVHDGSTNDVNEENKNSKRWFQRRVSREQPKNNARQSESRWGFRRRRPQHQESYDQREEIVLYCAPDLDENVYQSHHDNSDDSSDDCGHVMPTPIHPSEQERSHSPLRWRGRNRKNVNDSDKIENNPMSVIRPFLIGSLRGFKDDPSNYTDDHIDNDTISDYAIDVTSEKCRDRVIQSISEGIPGVQDDSLALDADESTAQLQDQPPRILRPIARLFGGPQQRQQRNIKIVIKEFHKLLRKEDWTLATNMLRSNPLLPQTWFSVERLYGGRYDGEVLPLHAACALRPPVSFIEELASIYPDAMLAKEKAFGRVPLHVACRSLAHSGVIKLLSQMEPKCVMARDSLDRVSMHYLIKNYANLGKDVELDHKTESCTEEQSLDKDGDSFIDDDGIVALKVLLEINPKCAHIADHRRWIPLHVACSSSSRKGMTNVIKLLLTTWPESVLCKTSKGSDVFDCVEMSGQHHPTKELVLSILRYAKEQIRMQEDVSDHLVHENENDNNVKPDSDGRPIDLDGDFENSDQGDECEDVDELLVDFGIVSEGECNDRDELILQDVKFQNGISESGSDDEGSMSNPGDKKIDELLDEDRSFFISDVAIDLVKSTEKFDTCEELSIDQDDAEDDTSFINCVSNHSHDHGALEPSEEASRTEKLNWYV